MYKRNKYNAIKVKDDGYTFDSKREHARYLHNKQRLKDGEISELEIHPVYQILVNDQKICRYTADSQYKNKEGTLIVEDVKSPITARMPRFRLIKKLMKAVHNITILEVY